MTLPSLKHIAILGSTGSIGKQTLDIVRRLPERLRVTALAAGTNAQALSDQALEFGANAVALFDISGAAVLAENLPRKVERYFGAGGLESIATRPDIDIVVVSVAGSVGTKATIAALLAGKIVALATKEVLVSAGGIVVEAAKRGGGRLITIDSEHSGVLQCLQGHAVESVKKVWLTASGGPFRNWPLEKLSEVTVYDALNHPVWRMGRKLTVDLATMMNKGLETIEAQWLFNLSVDQVGVVIYPQSTVHALVQFVDGSILAQLSTADMRLPIEYALLYPERINAELPELDVLKMGTLEFYEPDEARFPCLRLAREAAIAGGTASTILNAANEAAVSGFLSERLPFLGIANVVEKALEHHSVIKHPTLEEILSADEWARNFVNKAVSV